MSDSALHILLYQEAALDSPFGRYLEYQAYQELVGLLRFANALPSDYTVYAPSLVSVRDWILTRAGPVRGFRLEIEKLLAKLKASGSGIIDDICKVYCKLKGAITLGLDAATLFLTFKGAVAVAAAGASFAFLGAGLPLTALVAFLLRTGILDKVCNCPPTPKPEARPRKKKKGRQGA
jgi:hypothetical protein